MARGVVQAIVSDVHGWAAEDASIRRLRDAFGSGDEGVSAHRLLLEALKVAGVKWPDRAYVVGAVMEGRLQEPPPALDQSIDRLWDSARAAMTDPRGALVTFENANAAAVLIELTVRGDFYARELARLLKIIEGVTNLPLVTASPLEEGRLGTVIQEDPLLGKLMDDGSSAYLAELGDVLSGWYPGAIVTQELTHQGALLADLTATQGTALYEAMSQGVRPDSLGVSPEEIWQIASALVDAARQPPGMAQLSLQTRLDQQPNWGTGLRFPIDQDTRRLGTLQRPLQTMEAAVRVATANHLPQTADKSGEGV